jgi:cell division protein FtsI (penicillin-binding protein 3)
MVVVIDSAKGPNGDHGGTVAAPIFRSIAEAALHYLGIAPSINPSPPVLVAQRDAGEAAAAPPAETNQAVVSLVADAPPGTVPDLRGMSARDALRKLVKLGMAARVSGDGVVVSQEPAPGTPIDAEALCRLVLQRRPNAIATASQP